MSVQRAIRRRRVQKAGEKWPSRAQPFVYHDDGSYRVLRPRKGWLYVSAKRLRAQFILGQIREAINRRMGRT